MKNNKIFVVLFIVALIFSSMSTIVYATDIVENDSFDSEVENTLGIVDWETHFHTGFDSAFTSVRGNANQNHVQINGDQANFYGYYTGWKSDYIYYSETDSTEKTFSFGMDYGLYSGSGAVLQPQKWHSLLSLGFMVNCTKNEDGTISGFYFALEGYDTYYTTGGPNEIVVRKLDHMNFNDLEENSKKMVLEAEPIFRLEVAQQENLFEIKSSHTKFDVIQNEEIIFSFDLETALENEIPASDYTGGNDFGFYAGYVGSGMLYYDGNKSTGNHSCSELSVAEFTNVQIITKTVLPQSSVDVKFIDYTTKDDDSPEEIDTTYNKEGFVGQTYTVNPVANIGNFIFVESPDALTGTYIENTVPQIKLYYVHPQYTVKYVDESGNEISTSKLVDNGLELDTYKEEAINIEDYNLLSTNEQEITLTKDESNQTITFVYAMIEKTEPTIEVPKTEPPTIEVPKTEAPPKTEIPWTGDDFNLILFTGLLLFAVFGIGLCIWCFKSAVAKK